MQSPPGEPQHPDDRLDCGGLGGSQHPRSTSPVSPPRPSGFFTGVEDAVRALVVDGGTALVELAVSADGTTGEG